MYLIKTPKIIQNLFSNLTWKIPTSSKDLFLTFDDGPIPEVTPWVLSMLDQYDAKATFFCVGENIQKNPEIFDKIIENGHSVGNHTHNHLSGWTTENKPFFNNVAACANLVDSTLFRPPYGRIKRSQIYFLERQYNIVMWDVLSGDFDNTVSNDQCLQNVIKNAKQGSIIVFHDNVKAFTKLKFTLPKVLEYFSSMGYQFQSIDSKKLKARLAS